MPEGEAGYGREDRLGPSRLGAGASARRVARYTLCIRGQDTRTDILPGESRDLRWRILPRCLYGCQSTPVPYQHGALDRGTGHANARVAWSD